MNNANIGSASNVIGNPVNLIMSNATEEQLKKYDGNLGLPSHSLIIVNPLNNSTTDSTWNDICITDGNNGIKHIILLWLHLLSKFLLVNGIKTFVASFFLFLYSGLSLFLK